MSAGRIPNHLVTLKGPLVKSVPTISEESANTRIARVYFCGQQLIKPYCTVIGIVVL